ncbi:hypothetical protein LO80_01405 [Candidatus Francisella endociliophora]|uniref:Alpha/beta hydrolase n=1 Tax=Candidatus Francisella endociliophora TaxID=653937 RepID=A0A097EMG7_9GAMM|nr:hypothetical protein LO80_01405 [Francisella sp. FSC1006]
MDKGISGSAYIDGQASAGDELEFKLEDISFTAIVTAVRVSPNTSVNATNPTYITFASQESFLADDKSLLKYPDGNINDVLDKVLKDHDITADFQSDNGVFLDNVLQHGNSTLDKIISLCNQYGIVFYRDLRDDNKLKFCNTFGDKDVINVDVLDKQRATIETKPVAYITENIVADDNHNVLALGFNRYQGDGGYKQLVPAKNGLIQSPFIGTTSDLTKFYAQSLFNHFETYKNILALDGAGILIVGDKIHVDSKKLPIDTKDWYIVESNVSITTDSEGFNKLATCQYSAIAVADDVQNLATGILDQYKQTKFVKEGFAVKGYSDDTEDATTLNDNGKYQLSIPEYYKQIDEDEVINDVAKLHFIHTPDQKHSFPLVQESPTLVMELQDPTILGTRNTETRPAHNRKGYEQDYRLADNKHNSLNFIHAGAFKHNIANPKSTSSVVLESQKYRGSNRSAALRLGDESYRDIHKGKKPGMSLQSEGNFYELHPNYKATLYGNRNNVDAKYQSISPVYSLVTQRLNSDDYPYHWLEGINADEYHKQVVADSSSLTTQVNNKIATDATATNLIYDYTNKITQDIYLNTDHDYSTDDEHKLEYNEVTKDISVEGQITAESQAKEIKLTSNETTNTLHHTQKNINVDGDVNFNEVELEQNIAQEMNLVGGEIVITANKLVNNVPDGIKITTQKSIFDAEQIMSHGMYNIVNGDGNVDEDEESNEVIRIYIVDKYCTDEKVDNEDDKILNDKAKIVKYVKEDSALTDLLEIDYIKDAKYFEKGSDEGKYIPAEFKRDDKYFEMKLPKDVEIEAICLELNTLNISNNKFQSLIVGLNGEKVEDVVDDFKHHQNTISLKPENWQKIKDKQDNTETINTVETTINHLVINVFEPPMMINLREDYYFDYYKTKINYYVIMQQLTKISVNDDYIQSIDLAGYDRLYSWQKQELKTCIDGYNKLKAKYAPLAQYYADVSYENESHIVDDNFWQKHLVSLAKSQNKLLKRQKPGTDIKPNLTIAIHGYNVGVKEKVGNKELGYPQALEYMDSQYSVAENKLMNDTDWYNLGAYFKDNIQEMPNQKASILPFDSDKQSLEYNTDYENTAGGACKWNLHLEYSLNKAAGWDEKSLEDYNRIVQVAWQGDPKAPYDYSAAIAMSEFAGEKLAEVIDYLKQNGVKVNIMAHSLGNAVIMNTLKNVSQPVDQALCWEPAIANDSLSNSNRDEAVQTIANTYIKYKPDGTIELADTTQQYNVSYNYAKAADNAKKFTIAYSNLDEMLGPIPNIPSLFKKDEIANMSYSEAVNRILTHVIVSIGSYYFNTGRIGTSFADTTYKLIPNILAGNVNYDKYPEAKAIHQKIDDKAAGVLFGTIGAISYALDSFVAQTTTTNTTGGFESIYQIANKFIYPASYFVQGNLDKKYQAFYNKWLKVYPDNAPKLAINDLDSYDVNTYQNLSLRHKLAENYKQVNSSTDKDTLYDIASDVIDRLYDWTHGGNLNLPQQVWDGLEESLSNIFNQNPITTVWDTGMSFVGPAINLPGNATKSLASWLAGSSMRSGIKNIKDNKEELLAVVFTVLMQPNSKVAPAMGYSGVDDDTLERLGVQGGKLLQTPQEINTLELPESTRNNYPCYYMDGEDRVTTTYDKLTNVQKQTAKSMLCVDHSAMLFPTDDFMNYIYKGQLFGDPDLGLGFFGDYDMDKARANNKQYNQG